MLQHLPHRPGFALPKCSSLSRKRERKTPLQINATLSPVKESGDCIEFLVFFYKSTQAGDYIEIGSIRVETTFNFFFQNSRTLETTLRVTLKLLL